MKCEQCTKEIEELKKFIKDCIPVLFIVEGAMLPSSEEARNLIHKAGELLDDEELKNDTGSA